jgi:hypothetical protein
VVILAEESSIAHSCANECEQGGASPAQAAVLNTVELVEAIILALPTPDILLAATVSTTWQQIIESSPQVFQKFDFPWYIWTEGLPYECKAPSRYFYHRVDEGYFAGEVLSRTQCPMVHCTRFLSTITLYDSEPEEHIMLFFRELDGSRGGSIAVLEQGRKRKLSFITAAALHLELLPAHGEYFNPTFTYIIKDKLRDISFDGTLDTLGSQHRSLQAYLERHHPEVARMAEKHELCHGIMGTEREMEKSNSE